MLRYVQNFVSAHLNHSLVPFIFVALCTIMVVGIYLKSILEIVLIHNVTYRTIILTDLGILKEETGS